MSDPRDRLLEYALQVHFRGEQVRDLAPTVRRAWERGVRGSGIADLELPDPSFEDLEQLERELPRRPRTLLPWLVAAAAAALLLAFLWTRSGRGADGPGGALALEDDPSSADSDARPREPHAEGTGRADEPAGGVAVDPRSAPPDDLVTRTARAERLFRTLVWADVSAPLVAGSIEKLMRDSRLAGLALADLLGEEPRLWDVASAWFRAPFETEGDPGGAPYGEVRAVVLDLLAVEGSARAIHLAEALWPLAPESFAVEHLVAFAEAGAWIFEREVSAMIDEANSHSGGALPQGALSKGEPLVLPAAFLAARGDDRGRQILRDALDSPLFTRGGLPNALVAAAALERLGEERWRTAVREAVSWTEENLAGIGLAEGLRMLAAVQVLGDERTRGDLGSLGGLARRFEARWQQLEDQGIDRDRLIAALRAARE